VKVVKENSKRHNGWDADVEYGKELVCKLILYIDRAKNRGYTYSIISKWHTHVKRQVRGIEYRGIWHYTTSVDKEVIIYNRVELVDRCTKKHVKLFFYTGGSNNTGNMTGRWKRQ